MNLTSSTEFQAKQPSSVSEAMESIITRDLAEVVARVFQALSDPTRVLMLTALLKVELCVNDLASVLGMSQSAVSHQLRTLRDQKLVRSRRSGRIIYYALDDDHIRDLLEKALQHARH